MHWLEPIPRERAMHYIADGRVIEVRGDYGGHGHGTPLQEAARVGVHFALIY